MNRPWMLGFEAKTNPSSARGLGAAAGTGATKRLRRCGQQVHNMRRMHGRAAPLLERDPRISMRRYHMMSSRIVTKQLPRHQRWASGATLK